MPSAIFIVDIRKEHIAISEALKLGIPTFAMVDTNSDPNLVTYPIPANDDSSKSIQKIIETVTSAIKEGLIDREKSNAEKAKQKKKEAEKVENKESKDLKEKVENKESKDLKEKAK